MLPSTDHTNKSVSIKSKKITSGISVTSRSMSPFSLAATKVENFSETQHTKSTIKQNVLKQKEVTSDPESDYSKSLRMKTNHRFNGNLDFTTAVKLKVSPKRKNRKHKSKPCIRKSCSETNVYLLKPDNQGKSKVRVTSVDCVGTKTWNRNCSDLRQ